MSSSSDTEAASRGPAARQVLGRCQLFFWLGAGFDGAGAALLLLGVLTEQPRWDMLLYLGAGLFLLSLLWWVCWLVGNMELGPADEGLAPLPLGRSFEDLVGSISRSLAFQQGSLTTTFTGSVSTVTGRSYASQLQPPTPSLSQLDTAPRGRWGHGCSRNALDVQRRSEAREAQSGAVLGCWPQGLRAWFTQRPDTDPSRASVQPMAPTPQAL